MAGLFGNFVVPDQLAQPDDLKNWTGVDPPLNAAHFLRSATSLVLVASGASYYATDPATGMATDPVVAKTLSEATCIQAAAWIALGIDPATGGVIVAGVASKKSIGTASIDYADAGRAAQAKAQAVEQLVPEALRKLAANNLLDSNVWMYS
ncbi:hypothetical protein [Arthrobacter russicus]|uniref:Head decoration protein n=1 Tax=Arthrobacter russicus TaxID=172040 RepID=A0ABU1J9U4_9MICC|nr:hypothetical protein [Arthrobacter russicus]MDR6268915.1 hypothetical protein [Arthrobacter russicus]